MKLLLCLLVLLTVSAQSAPDYSGILEGYEKSRIAARLRYLDGMFAVRTRDFAAFTAQGVRLDVSAERARYQSLFSDATRVRLTHKFGPFLSTPTGVKCRVEHRLLVEKFDSTKKGLYTLDARMVSDDLWSKTSGGWKMRACAIQSQRMGKGEAMEPALAEQDVLGQPVRHKGPK